MDLKWTKNGPKMDPIIDPNEKKDPKKTKNGKKLTEIEIRPSNFES